MSAGGVKRPAKVSGGVNGGLCACWRFEWRPACAARAGCFSNVPCRTSNEANDAPCELTKIGAPPHQAEEVPAVESSMESPPEITQPDTASNERQARAGKGLSGKSRKKKKGKKR